jgi:RHS repeat-associated protein
MELDDSGAVISYEECHPYGSTAFHVGDGNAEVSAKRYRYTGKERDEETGLYYHGVRYYPPWLARWTSTDRLGLRQPGETDLNLYAYVRCSPITRID